MLCKTDVFGRLLNLTFPVIDLPVIGLKMQPQRNMHLKHCLLFTRDKVCLLSVNHILVWCHLLKILTNVDVLLCKCASDPSPKAECVWRLKRPTSIHSPLFQHACHTMQIQLRPYCWFSSWNATRAADARLVCLVATRLPKPSTLIGAYQPSKRKDVPFLR